MNKTFEALIDVSKSYEDKIEGQESKWIVEGLAATSDLDLRDDIIAKEALDGAADDLIDSSLLWNHESASKPIGTVIESKSVDKGLFVKAVISKTAPDIWEQIQDGSVNKFSVQGRVVKAFTKFVSALKRTIRIIEQIELFEASLVCLPANPAAKVLSFYIQKSLGPVEQETPSNSTVEASGSDLNQHWLDSRDSFREANEASKKKPELGDYARRVQKKVEEDRENALIQSGQILKKITCSLEESARFCGVTNKQMAEALEFPSLAGAKRIGYENELWSGIIVAHRAYIQKSFGIIPEVKKHINSRNDRRKVRLSREEILAFSNIKVRPE